MYHIQILRGKQVISLFSQSFQGNIFFLIFINCILLLLLILGECWYQQKLLFLFPRYLQIYMTMKQQQQTYQLNANERYVVQKLGRQLVLSISLIYIMILTWMYMYHILSWQYYGILCLILIVLLIYHFVHKVQRQL